MAETNIERKDNKVITEQFVRETIERHIASNDKRISALMKPLVSTADLVTVEQLEHENLALHKLQHDLRLCDCPQETAGEQDGTAH
jgi:hypothetical protein